MPTRIRRDKKKCASLTAGQVWELLLGPRSDRAKQCAFEDDDSRRAAWRTFGEQILRSDPDSQCWALEAFGPPMLGAARRG